MDFIEGLPKLKGKIVILVVVGRLTNFGHFLAMTHPYTVVIVAQKYMSHIFKLHGLPDSIVSNTERVFVSNFWQDLFKRVETKLHLSTAYHPELDGQIEVLNICLEGYHCYITGEHPNDWSKWLPLEEWWYNLTYHSTNQI